MKSILIKHEYVCLSAFSEATQHHEILAHSIDWAKLRQTELSISSTNNLEQTVPKHTGHFRT